MILYPLFTKLKLKHTVNAWAHEASWLWGLSKNAVQDLRSSDPLRIYLFNVLFSWSLYRLYCPKLPSRGLPLEPLGDLTTLLQVSFTKLKSEPIQIVIDTVYVEAEIGKACTRREINIQQKLMWVNIIIIKGLFEAVNLTSIWSSSPLFQTTRLEQTRQPGDWLTLSLCTLYNP